MLMAARAKKEAIAAYDQGDLSTTRTGVAAARAYIAATAVSPETLRELDEIAKLEGDLAEGEGAKFRKRSAWQVFSKKRGRES